MGHSTTKACGKRGEAWQRCLLLWLSAGFLLQERRAAVPPQAGDARRTVREGGAYKMKLTVNGEPLEIEHPINLEELLVVAKAEQPEYVTVELNGEFVNHAGFASTRVQDGDTVEFLYFMGGGAR